MSVCRLAQGIILAVSVQLCECFSAAVALWRKRTTTDNHAVHARLLFWLCAAVVLQVDPAKVIILEGILVLHIPELREQCSMRIYVDTGQHCQHCACSSCTCFVQRK
jgi:hypothetical protein